MNIHAVVKFRPALRWRPVPTQTPREPAAQRGIYAKGPRRRAGRPCTYYMHTIRDAGVARQRRWCRGVGGERGRACSTTWRGRQTTRSPCTGL